MTRALPALDTQVTACDVRVLSVPLDPQIITAHYTITTIELVVIRLRDVDGVEGFATLWCFGVPQARVLVAMLEYLAPGVVGTRPGTIAATSGALRKEVNFFGSKGVSIFALSGLDMALHDLLCRRQQTSLSALLGRQRDALPVYWSGLFLNQTTDELCAEVEAKLQAGFRAFKLRTGKPTLAEDVARTAAVSRVLPPDATLMLDAVQSWSPTEAIAAAQQLAEFAPLWLEDPLVHDDYAGLDAVVAGSPIPIATGENEYLCDGFERILDSGAPYLLADLQRVGGITEWLKLADRANALGRTLTPHVYPHVAVQLCASLVQEERWIEYIPWWDALLATPLVVRDGHLEVPDTVGSGGAFDPAALDAYALGPWRPAA